MDWSTRPPTAVIPGEMTASLGSFRDRLRGGFDTCQRVMTRTRHRRFLPPELLVNVCTLSNASSLVESAGVSTVVRTTVDTTHHTTMCTTLSTAMRMAGRSIRYWSDVCAEFAACSTLRCCASSRGDHLTDSQSFLSTFSQGEIRDAGTVERKVNLMGDLTEISSALAPVGSTTRVDGGYLPSVQPYVETHCIAMMTASSSALLQAVVCAKQCADQLVDKNATYHPWLMLSETVCELGHVHARRQAYSRFSGRVVATGVQTVQLLDEVRITGLPIQATSTTIHKEAMNSVVIPVFYSAIVRAFGYVLEKAVSAVAITDHASIFAKSAEPVVGTTWHKAKTLPIHRTLVRAGNHVRPQTAVLIIVRAAAAGHTALSNSAVSDTHCQTQVQGCQKGLRTTAGSTRRSSSFRVDTSSGYRATTRLRETLCFRIFHRGLPSSRSKTCEMGVSARLQLAHTHADRQIGCAVQVLV